MYTVHQSAATLLRKLSLEFDSRPTIASSGPVDTFTEQDLLMKELKSLLEQCLLVDNFNKDVDTSLLRSYVKEDKVTVDADADAMPTKRKYHSPQITTENCYKMEETKV